jgi:dCMP deaminase
MDIAELVASRSTCLRRKVGAVIVKEKRILTTGYNGAPSGAAHCLDIGCLREQRNIPSGERHELCRALHAEQNAIIQAAKHGINISGSTLYCTNSPCAICAKMVLSSEIGTIYYARGYPDDFAREMFEETGITLIQYGRPDSN